MRKMETGQERKEWGKGRKEIREEKKSEQNEKMKKSVQIPKKKTKKFELPPQDLFKQFFFFLQKNLHRNNHWIFHV